jgi:glycerophosphoryl diester phosphodiesterase
VELKSSQHPDSGDPVLLAEETLDVMQGYLDRTVFVGFDWRGLLRIKQLAPDARCWFSTDRLQGDVQPVLNAMASAKADGWFAQAANATAETIAQARQLGLKVGAWTVNEPAEMKRLLAQELNAICTDRPDLLQSLE